MRCRSFLKFGAVILLSAAPTLAIADDLPPELDVVSASSSDLVVADAESTLYDYDKGAQCCDAPWRLFPQNDCGSSIRGWVNGGIMGNADSPSSGFNGPYNAIDRSNEGTLNQLYMIGEFALPECGWGIGGRVDALYGQDYFLAESIGMEKTNTGTPHWNTGTYGFAIPQAYASIGNQSLSVQLGHFYSVVGYEGLMAPDNFFYSKSYSYQFAGPFTHWGGQVNWKPSESWTFQAGLHQGWDALEKVQDEIGFVGKARYDHCSGIWTSFALVSGEDGNNSAADPNVVDDFTARTRYSWLVGLPVGCNMEYVFHNWYGVQDDVTAVGSEANWYGIDQYLYYTVNDCWRIGGRFEWFRDADGTRVGLNRANNPNGPPLNGDFYSATLGLNWSPNANITIRPEVRVDWQNNNTSGLAYDDGNNDDQFTYGIDAIFRF
jgi:hypothetical protein